MAIHIDEPWDKEKIFLPVSIDEATEPNEYTTTLVSALADDISQIQENGSCI